MPDIPNNIDELLELIAQEIIDNNSGLIEEHTLRYVLNQLVKILDTKVSLISPTLTAEQLQMWKKLADFKASDFIGNIQGDTVFPDVKSWGFAAPGSYPLADNITIDVNHLGVISHDGSSFSKIQISVPPSKPQEFVTVAEYEALETAGNVDNGTAYHIEGEENPNAGVGQDVTDKGFFITDNDGNVAFQLDENGETSVILSNLSVSELQKKLSEFQGNGIQYNINHVIGYGQSLGEGYNSNAITIASFSDQAVMFNHGLKTRFGAAPMYQSFVPHVEQTIAGCGETPMAGMAINFLKKSNIKGDVKLLSSCDAMSGKSIEELSKGSTFYANIIADVTNGRLLALKQGLSYRVAAITWTQGEHNNADTKEAYKAKLVQLRNDLITDIEDITGDDYSDLPFITYQVATNAAYSTNVALAQLELSTTAGSGFFMSTPMYHFSYSDAQHLDATSYKRYGNYIGRALYEILIKGKSEPLFPADHYIISNDVYLRFNKKNLVFDKPATLTASIANKGFNIKNSSNVDIITNVQIVSADVVRISCSENPAGKKVLYGAQNINGKNAGELRDSDKELTAENETLYNYCTIFEINL